MTENRDRQSPKPPSRPVRLIARIGIPLGILFGVLAVLGGLSFVLNLVQGNGPYRVVMSLGMLVAFAGLAYGVGIELRRNVAAWDQAIDERQQLSSSDG